MLVVSRKLKEKILLPGLGVAVQVVGIKAGTVRLGIDAPPEVTVLREELCNRAAEWAPAGAPLTARPAGAGPASIIRQIGDRLGATALGLGLLQLQLDTGLLEDARATLAGLRDDFRLLRLGVEGEMEQPLPRPAAAPRKATRALLVEDDSNQRGLLASFLRLSGLEVDTAGDGCDALDRLRAGARPDVVLLDMGLPRCDGPTAVRTIRRDPAYEDTLGAASRGCRHRGQPGWDIGADPGCFPLCSTSAAPLKAVFAPLPLRRPAVPRPEKGDLVPPFLNQSPSSTSTRCAGNRNRDGVSQFFSISCRPRP